MPARRARKVLNVADAASMYDPLMQWLLLMPTCDASRHQNGCVHQLKWRQLSTQHLARAACGFRCSSLSHCRRSALSLDRHSAHSISSPPCALTTSCPRSGRRNLRQQQRQRRGSESEAWAERRREQTAERECLCGDCSSTAPHSTLRAMSN